MKKNYFLLIMLFGAWGAFAQYCEPASDCTDGDLILLFDFAGIENVSDCESGGVAGYSDYTDSVAPGLIEPGETYTVAALVGWGWSVETVAVWIDYDESGTFDESEYSLIGAGSDELVIGSLTVPDDVTPGEKRLRVRVLAGPEIAPGAACDDFAFGETEDYLVEVPDVSVNDNTLAGFSFYPNPVKDILKIQSQEIVNEVSIFDVSGKLAYQGTPNTVSPEVNMTNFNSGVYFVKVTIGNSSKTVKVIR